MGRSFQQTSSIKTLTRWKTAIDGIPAGATGPAGPAGLLVLMVLLVLLVPLVLTQPYPGLRVLTGADSTVPGLRVLLVRMVRMVLMAWWNGGACEVNQIVRYNGSAWVCATDPFANLSCSAGDTLTYDGMRLLVAVFHPARPLPIVTLTRRLLIGLLVGNTSQYGDYHQVVYWGCD